MVNICGHKFAEYGIPQSNIQDRFGYTGQTSLPEIGMWHCKARIYNLGDPIYNGAQLLNNAYNADGSLKSKGRASLIDRYIYDRAGRVSQLKLRTVQSGVWADNSVWDCTRNAAGQLASVARSNNDFARTAHSPFERDYSSEGHVLVTGPTMRCSSVGGAGGTRTAAWCVLPKSGDLSCAMVRGGWALRWDRYRQGHRC